MKIKYQNLKLKALLKLGLALMLFVVSAPSFAINCSHASSDMKNCMLMCNAHETKQDQSGKTAFSAKPCMQVVAIEGQSLNYVAPSEEQALILSLLSVDGSVTTAYVGDAGLSFINHDPPGLRMPAGYPALPTSHGPPQG